MSETTDQGAARQYQDAPLEGIRRQARRYLEARYGTDVWFRAPETFANVLERWLWAVASAVPDLAEECIAQIEQHFSDRGQ